MNKRPNLPLLKFNTAAPGKSWPSRLNPTSAKNGCSSCLPHCRTSCPSCSSRQQQPRYPPCQSYPKPCRKISAPSCSTAGATTRPTANAPARPIPSPAPWAPRTSASPPGWCRISPSRPSLPPPMNGATPYMNRACPARATTTSPGPWVRPPRWGCTSRSRCSGNAAWAAAAPSPSAGIRASALA